jgi:CheY-like chemotaxis protein
MEKIINILLIEDDKLDLMDAKRTLDKMGVLHIMQIARDGEEAIGMLTRFQKENPGSLPDIILLDLNMPKMNGIEFLQNLRREERWRNIKVFVLTTSEEREDREQTAKLGVSGYIVKPLKLNNPSSIDSFNLMIDMLNIKNRI